MEHDNDGYLALSALAARGGVCREDTQCGMILIEVLGSILHIYGQERLYLSNGSDLFLPRREYHYYLEAAQAARLLVSLREDYGGTALPETVIMQQFEFSNPLCSLHDYLDSHQIAHDYVTDVLPL